MKLQSIYSRQGISECIQESIDARKGRTKNLPI